MADQYLNSRPSYYVTLNSELLVSKSAVFICVLVYTDELMHQCCKFGN